MSSLDQRIKDAYAAVDDMKVGDLVHCMLECRMDYDNLESPGYEMYFRAKERLNELLEESDLG